MSVEAYIGVGSNLGDSLALCREAVDRMERSPGITVKAVSPWYRSRPVGVKDEQNWYVNVVVLLETALSPRDLLEALLGIEAGMGRVRKKRWESRLIDLDLLLYGAERICMDGLEIPHPRMHLRKFVLLPLSDLAPDLVPPGMDSPVREFLERLDDKGQDVLRI